MNNEQEKKEKKKRGVPRERKRNWREEYATMEDIKDFLSEHVMLRYNVISGRTEVHVIDRAPEPPDAATATAEDYLRWFEEWQGYESMGNGEYETPPRPSGTPPLEGRGVPAAQDYYVPMTDRIENTLYTRMRQKKEVRMQDLLCVIHSDFVLEYHPFRQYLDALPRWYEERGDYIMELSQYGLVCCEELDTMRPSELNQLKAAMTMPSVDERAAYARHKEHRPHIASFCGTGNNVQFLSDTTGNRRWLPFEIESIESPRSVPFNYTGIYSQAYTLYKQGFRYWFSPEEIRRLARHNEQFETPSLEKELIDQYFRRPEGQEPYEKMPVSLAIQIVGGNLAQRLTHVGMGRAFVALGYQFKTVSGSRHYLVVRRSAEEMRAKRQAAGEDSEDGEAVF